MFEVKTTDQTGVQLLLDWAAAEGWNPGLDDAGAFYSADQKGFLLGFYNNQPIAGISVVASGHHFGFLGLYITRPDFRGRGFGLKTWRTGLARLNQRTIGLDGVVAQQTNYARSGFKTVHRSLRYSGKVDVASADASNVRSITQQDVPIIVQFDVAHYGAVREHFLGHWLNGQGGRQGFIAVIDGSVNGYGVIRPCQSGFKVGPLFADTPAIAESLLISMTRLSGQETVAIDVPEPNVAAQQLLERFGLAPIFETARMYRGPAPSLPLDRIFGLTSFELG
jgi:ribosomal protein S18 acetylase RimI-like enzyme